MSKRKVFPKPRLNKTEKWYEGVEVPLPDVPKGYELKSIGIGLQLNAIPPYATYYLEKVDPAAPKPNLTGGWV